MPKQNVPFTLPSNISMNEKHLAGMTAGRKASGSIEVDKDGDTFELNDGAVLIAAITSCTNTSNPAVMIGAGLLARNAVEKGLIDGIGHLVPTMKERFGDKVRFRTYGQKKGLFARIGARVFDDTLDAVEERAAFARFGL